MAESPELPDGFRWFKIELRRSVMVIFVVFCTVFERMLEIVRGWGCRRDEVMESGDAEVQ